VLKLYPDKEIPNRRDELEKEGDTMTSQLGIEDDTG
jgi:hypothetical protein